MAPQDEIEFGEQGPVSTAVSDSPATSNQAPAAGQRRHGRWIETLSALLLGLTTVATAWSAYQGTRWSGVQSTLYADALGVMVESSEAAATAQQRTLLDAAMFMHYVNLYAGGDENLSDWYYARFRPEFRSAVDAWLALDPNNNPEAPPDPFQMPEYLASTEGQADQLKEDASKLFEEGKTANQISDDYILNAVILASVLFLAGIAPGFDWRPVSAGVLALSLVLLLVALYNLATLPIH
jgi:hypothetical protein